jgi:hypothetical protein
MDAANEGIFVVGQVSLEGGPSAGSKTISSSGGGIVWRPSSTITFANASTNLRLGLQDLNAADYDGDGIWDVHADLVGGTDTITSGAMTTTNMETGTKTLSHGDFIAAGIQMTSRGGTDSVSTLYATTASSDTTPSPGVVSVSTSSTWTSISGFPFVGIIFDDGTKGYFHRSLVLDAASSVSVNINTATADEYGNLIIPDVDVAVTGADVCITGVTSSEPEINLYSDPLGTPTLLESVSISRPTLAHTGHVSVMFSQEHRLKAGTEYALTVRPTTANNMSIHYNQVDAETSHWDFTGVPAETCYAVRRLNNTGAFSDWAVSVAKGNRMLVTLLVDKYRVSAGRASINIGI